MTLGTFHGTGRLAADPELRARPNGDLVASFTLAFSQDRKDEHTGEWVTERREFVRCSAWKQLAENIAASLKKGDEVVVTGRRYVREYDHQGTRRYSVEMSVDAIGPSLRAATAQPTRTEKPPTPARDDDQPPL